MPKRQEDKIREIINEGIEQTYCSFTSYGESLIGILHKHYTEDTALRGKGRPTQEMLLLSDKVFAAGHDKLRKQLEYINGAISAKVLLELQNGESERRDNEKRKTEFSMISDLAQRLNSSPSSPNVLNIKQEKEIKTEPIFEAALVSL